MDRQCRVINGGVFDTLTLGRAEWLGNGRYQQVVGDRDNSLVYVADCNTRQATLLRGHATLNAPELWTSCGPSATFDDLAGPDAVMSMSEGEDLHALVALAEARGAKELNPLEHFFEFQINAGEDRHAVGAKDRFDLMCGCKYWAPESPGGRQ